MIKIYLLNTFFLILIESFISIIVFMSLNDGFELINDYSFLESLYMLPFWYLLQVNFAIGVKLLFDFIPKLAVQYLLIKVYGYNLRFTMLWFGLLLIGILLSTFWWWNSNFVIRLNTNNIIAISYVPAIILSPFILKKLGWNIVEKLIDKLQEMK